MTKLLLLLPVMNIKRISDEQGIALITSYLRKNEHSVDMQVIENVDDIDGIALGNYDLIGITAYHENLLNVYKMSEKIKQIDKDIRICIGGYSATYYYEEILNDCPWIDFIIKGEGEEVFLELCNRIDNKESIFDVQGIIYRGDEGIVVNPDRECIKDLDSLPFAAKDIFNRHHLGLVLLSTSRGCLNNCSFCYSHSYFDASGGVKWRGRSVNNVIDEILYIKSNYEIDKFFFNNASFEDSFPPLEFLKNFAKEITDREINISYCANFRANFYRFCDDNLKKLLIQSGLTGSFVGIEAFNESDLQLYNKHTTVNDNINSIQFFRNMGIGLDIGFINFNPYSTVETLKQNEENLYKTRFLCTHNFMNKLRAYKGTALYEKIENDNLLRSSQYLDYYNYSYVNKNIGMFADYINNIFSNDFASVPGSMVYFTMYHNQLISHLKHIYRRENGIIDIVLDYEYERNILLEECNDFCHYWYRELLNMLENCWDARCADRFIDDVGVKIVSKELEEKMKKAYRKFSKRLLQVDKDAFRHLR